MLYNRWTNPEIERLKKMRKEGYQAVDIARALNRTKKSVDNKIVDLKTTVLRDKPAVTARKCLKCKKPFQSKGSGNRLCGNCISSNSTSSHIEYALSI